MNAGGLLKEFFIKLGLDTDQASFSVGMVAAQLFEKALGGIAERAVDLLKSIPELVGEVAEMGDKIDEASQRSGIGREALQELAYAGKFSSLSMEDVAEATGHMVRKMGEAAAGSKETAAAFTHAGIKIKDTNGHLRAGEDVLGDIADHMASLPDGSDKVKFAFDTLGKSGTRLIPMLNGGSAGLKKYAAEAHELGAILDDSLIDQGAAYRDSVDRMHEAWKGMKITLAGPLMRAFTSIMNWFKNVIVAARPVGAVLAQVWRVVAHAVLMVVDALRAVWATLKFIAKGWALIFGLIGDGVAGLWDKLGTLTKVIAVAAAAWFAWFSLAASPVLVLAAILAFLYLLVDDILTGLRGGKSVVFELFDAWSEWLDAWLTPDDNDPWWLTLIKSFLYGITHLGEVWDTIVAGMRAAFTALVDWVMAKVQWVLDAANAIADQFRDTGTGGLYGRAASLAGVGGGPATTPTTGQIFAQAGAGAKSVTASLNIGNLTVQVPPGANITETVNAFSKALDEHTQKMLQHAQAGVQ